ncbi:MAG: hypothetical protein GQ475_05925 [Methylococcaceae bacterium]|nr:hypothetical protein [Methylococcaceae bacterium]
MRNKHVLTIVAIPFILLCLLIVRAEHHLATGTQWNIEMTGYDPRDILRGHYLRFRLAYDWQGEENTCQTGRTCCLCLTDTGNKAPKVHKTSCSIAKAQCDSFIQSDYETSLNRFYIPENEARRAEKLVQNARAENNAYLTISVNKRGEPRIVDLLVGEQSINEILDLPEQ